MIQTATIPDTKTRILAIATLNDDITTAGGVGYTDSGDKLVNGRLAAWLDAELPAVVVRHARTVSRKWVTLSKVQVARQYSVFLFAARSAAKTDDAELDAIAAAEALIDSLPNQFISRPALHLNSASDGIALSSSPLLDEGAVIVAYGGVDFGAVKYTITVETIENG
jgi:hypothetical protein